MNIINPSLHQEFRKLAFDINKMKNRLISLLLEIYQKEIYKQHGCLTIYEYGLKYAKLSKETVQLALRTLKNTEDKPFLREKIETQGIYKVAMVAKLATPETDKLYAEYVENMSKPALFEFAKEMRNAEEKHQEKTQDDFQKELLEDSNEKYSVKCHAVAPKMTIELDEEAQILFNQLKKKYAKDLSNKEALKIILKNIFSQQKNVPGNGILENSKSAATQKNIIIKRIKTRPTRVKNINNAQKRPSSPPATFSSKHKEKSTKKQTANALIQPAQGR